MGRSDAFHNRRLAALDTPDGFRSREAGLGLGKGWGRILVGGDRLPGSGNFLQPTVITDVKPGTAASYEELFRPVAMLFVVRDADEAIRMANDSPFGLGASAWTNGPDDQMKFVDEIESGMVFINGMVASDPTIPFGGAKQSGYGRELGLYGIREFLNAKTVWIKSGTEASRLRKTE